MKYTSAVVGAAIAVLALFYISTHPPGVAVDSRGERQWSITQRATDGYKAVISDREEPKLPEEERAEGSSAQAPGVSSAGAPEESVAKNGHNHLNSQVGKEPAAKPLQDSTTALRQGQAPGQVSNVPGTTSTSPNGTSNAYGTGGTPVFPPKDTKEK